MQTKNHRIRRRGKLAIIDICLKPSFPYKKDNYPTKNATIGAFGV